MKLFTVKGKTDVNKERHWVYIRACGNETDPVHNKTKCMKYVPAELKQQIWKL